MRAENLTASRVAGSPGAQFKHLRYDVGEMMNWRWWRWVTCWQRAQFWAVASYRLERAAYLGSGRTWPAVKLVVRPLLWGIRPKTVDIDCEASIGRGLCIAHPALGVVVSRHAILGERAVLTGGNCIGTRRDFVPGDELRIGDDFNLGANAIVLGPIHLGDRVRVGAGAVATRDAGDGAVVRVSTAAVYPPQ